LEKKYSGQLVFKKGGRGNRRHVKPSITARLGAQLLRERGGRHSVLRRFSGIQNLGERHGEEWGNGGRALKRD